MLSTVLRHTFLLNRSFGGGADYNCIICSGPFKGKTAIWSCEKCSNVVHFSCMLKWCLENESTCIRLLDAMDSQTQSVTPRKNKNARDIVAFKCSHCSHLYGPLRYGIPRGLYKRCWFGSSRQDTPGGSIYRFSCKSSHKIVPCGHQCTEACHPGSCYPCQIVVKDGCKHQERLTTCSDILTCEEVCDNKLSCGHNCNSKCHKDSKCKPCHRLLRITCESCKSKVFSNKYIKCGEIQSEIAALAKLYSMGNSVQKKLTQYIKKEIANSNSVTVRGWCIAPCSKNDLTCGHRCMYTCDTHAEFPCVCAEQPVGKEGEKCVCGKTDSTNIRVLCTDKQEHCFNPCGRTLDCGHQCPLVCHSGCCKSTDCIERINLRCRCGIQAKSVGCCDTDIREFLCNRRCNTSLKCGHKCDEVCCPLRGQGNLHECTEPCNRSNACGHTCSLPCHIPRPCPPCGKSIISDVFCSCNGTRIRARGPCDSKPDKTCHNICEKLMECGHECVYDCHEGECPPCLYQLRLPCQCQNTSLYFYCSRIPDAISCGFYKCGTYFSCGIHCCTNKCACTDDHDNCVELCTKVRPYCFHTCGRRCHGAEPCPDDTCEAKVPVKCPCGKNRGGYIVCNAALEDGRRTYGDDYIVYAKTNFITCDEECEKHRRALGLRTALVDEDAVQSYTSKAVKPTFSDLPCSSDALDYWSSFVSLIINGSLPLPEERLTYWILYNAETFVKLCESICASPLDTSQATYFNINIPRPDVVATINAIQSVVCGLFKAKLNVVMRKIGKLASLNFTITKRKVEYPWNTIRNAFLCSYDHDLLVPIALTLCCSETVPETNRLVSFNSAILNSLVISFEPDKPMERFELIEALYILLGAELHRQVRIRTPDIFDLIGIQRPEVHMRQFSWVPRAFVGRHYKDIYKFLRVAITSDEGGGTATNSNPQSKRSITGLLESVPPHARPDLETLARIPPDKVSVEWFQCFAEKRRENMVKSVIVESTSPIQLGVFIQSLITSAKHTRSLFTKLIGLKMKLLSEDSDLNVLFINLQDSLARNRVLGSEKICVKDNVKTAAIPHISGLSAFAALGSDGSDG